MSHWQLLGKEAARVCFEPAFHPLCRLKQRISMPVFIVSAGRAPAEVPKSSLRRHRCKDLEQQVTAQSWRDLLQPHLEHPARLWGAHEQKPWRFRARRRDAPAVPRPKAGAASPANKRLPRGERNSQPPFPGGATEGVANCYLHGWKRPGKVQWLCPPAFRVR